MKDYIIRIDETQKDIMGGHPLLEPPKELIRCKDCKHYKDGTGMCALYHAHGYAETWFCADGERR